MANILVFDHPKFFREMGEALQPLGHDIFCFCDFEDFLKMDEAGQLPSFDLIVTRDNFRMPGDDQFSYGDNLAHVRKLKQQLRYSDIPIIGHTAFQYRLDSKAEIDALFSAFGQSSESAILEAVNLHVPRLAGKPGQLKLFSSNIVCG